MIMMMGDWNAKIGAAQEGEDGVIGRHGLGDKRSQSGVRFVSFCALSQQLSYCINNVSAQDHTQIHLDCS